MALLKLLPKMKHMNSKINLFQRKKIIYLLYLKNNSKRKYISFKIKINIINILYLLNIIKEWGLGIGGLGPIPNPQSPIPNPQSPIPLIN